VQEVIKINPIPSFTITRSHVTGYTDEKTKLPAFVMYGYMKHADTSNSGILYFSEEFIRVFNLLEMNKSATAEHEITQISNAVKFNWAKLKKIKFELTWKTEKLREQNIRRTVLKQSTYSSVQSLLESITMEIDTLTEHTNIFKLYIRNFAEKVVISQLPSSFRFSKSKKNLDGMYRWAVRMSTRLYTKLGFSSFVNEESKHPQWLFGDSYWEDTALASLAINYQNMNFFALSSVEADNQPADDPIASGAIPSFWIYTDIIDEQHVGAYKQKLLRVLANNATEGNYHIETLDPYYLRVRCNRVQMIGIDVCTGTNSCNLGSEVYLDNPVVLVMHFRPVQ
jgi:hypothetical protein